MDLFENKVNMVFESKNQSSVCWVNFFLKIKDNKMFQSPPAHIARLQDIMPRSNYCTMGNQEFVPNNNFSIQMHLVRIFSFKISSIHLQDIIQQFQSLVETLVLLLYGTVKGFTMELVCSTTILSMGSTMVEMLVCGWQLSWKSSWQCG
jgi:hypothetical protein